MPDSSGAAKQGGATCSWRRWTRWCRGQHRARRSSGTIRKNRSAAVACGGSRTDAAHSLPAAVVRTARSGGRRGAVRLDGERRFVGIDLRSEGAPEETTVCKFRHLLEKHGLVKPLREAVKVTPDSKPTRYSKRGDVGAMACPSNTRNCRCICT